MSMRNPKEKTVSVRMPEELIERLQALAYVEGESVGAEIRIAVEERISSLREEPAFMERLEAARRRQAEALTRLAHAGRGR